MQQKGVESLTGLHSPLVPLLPTWLALAAPCAWLCFWTAAFCSRAASSVPPLLQVSVLAAAEAAKSSPARQATAWRLAMLWLRRLQRGLDEYSHLLGTHSQQPSHNMARRQAVACLAGLLLAASAAASTETCNSGGTEEAALLQKAAVQKHNQAQGAASASQVGSNGTKGECNPVNDSTPFCCWNWPPTVEEQTCATCDSCDYRDNLGTVCTSAERPDDRMYCSEGRYTPGVNPDVDACLQDCMYDCQEMACIDTSPGSDGTCIEGSCNGGVCVMAECVR